MNCLFRHNHLNQKRDATRKERTKPELEDREPRDTLTELLRAGARKLLRQALEAEVGDLLASNGDDRDEAGRAVVVRSGYHPVRELQTRIDPVTVQVPKVRSRQGDPVTVRSALGPPYVRKTRSAPSTFFCKTMRPSMRRPRPVYRKIGRPCSHSTRSRLHTGKVFGRRIRLNRPLGRFGIEPSGRRAV